MVQIKEKEFRELSDYVYLNFGIHLTQKKKALVMSRLHKVLESRKIPSFEKYLWEMKRDTTMKMASELIDHISTNHTFFLREKSHFDFLEEEVIPWILQASKSERDLRIWSAGCSSGQEPYTLAMILFPYFQNKGWDKRILATDISNRVLELAKLGIYPVEQIQNVPESWKRKFFTQKNEFSVEVKPFIREEIIFRRFNLMNSKFPFQKPLHVIFCRNVMIYFDKETIQRLIKRFYDVLMPGGYLITGQSEALDRDKIPFKYVKPSIYRKE